MTLVSASGLSKSYGGVRVLDAVDFDVKAGEIHALVGENGAGKSTLIKILGGAVVPDAGEVQLDGVKLPPGDPRAVRRHGVSIVYQEFTLVPEMSVLDNLRMGAGVPRARARERQTLDEVFALFPRLRERQPQLARTLSGGERQMLAIGRALMGCPDVLLLDEPSLGLAPMIVVKIFEVIRQLNAEGMSVLLVEQNARMALKLARRGYVIETGSITMTDTGEALLANPKVQDAYLGE